MSREGVFGVGVGVGGSRCRRTLPFFVLSGCWGCFVFCFHIMLFCSEFTSEEFSSPRTLWFSCLGVRELWMLRESSSLVGAFTGSSSLFWELGSSYPGRGGSEGSGAESTVRTTTTVSRLLKFFNASVAKSDQTIRTSSKTMFLFQVKRKSPLYPEVKHPCWTILHITIYVQR